MKLAGTIRPTETMEVDAEGDDLEAARAAALAKLPAGYELIRVSSLRTTASQGVVVHAVGRVSAGREITAAGQGYDAARAALLTEVPAGHQLLSVRVIEG